MGKPLDYGTVSQAIGEATIWWSGIEAMAQAVALRLAIHNEPSFGEQNAVDQLNIILTNMGQRQLFAAMKALAFKGSPDDIFPRLEPILNNIDNNIRPERNRFIHDSWKSTHGGTERITRSTKITNQQGKRELRLMETETYETFDDIDALNRRLKGAFAELEAICEELSAIIKSRWTEQPPECPESSR